LYFLCIIDNDDTIYTTRSKRCKRENDDDAQNFCNVVESKTQTMASSSTSTYNNLSIDEVS